MLSISNLTGIYSTFIFIGLILSLILFTIYNSSFSELNYNIRRYPLPSLRPGKILLYLSLLLSLWIFIPLSIKTLFESYFYILATNNVRLREILLSSMNHQSVGGDVTVNFSESHTKSLLKSVSSTVTSNIILNKGKYVIAAANSNSTIETFNSILAEPHNNSTNVKSLPPPPCIRKGTRACENKSLSRV